MLAIQVLDVVLIVGGTVYCCAILWLVRGLYRPAPIRGNQLPSLSIIVAARNEEQALPACLAALRQQDYAGIWEVIVVDDRSQDRTSALLAETVDEWPQFRALRAAEKPLFLCPKKSALAQGIAVSKGEVLLFTDADCRPPADWARSMAAYFVEGIGLVAGHAQPLGGRTFMQRLLAIDNLAVGALGAGSFAQGRPLSCTGRSLGYRRQVYDEVGGFESIGHLLGGDDVYFMRIVAKNTKWMQVFNRDAVVECLPPPEKWQDIIQQKMRHAAKGGHYGGAALALAVLVYLFHCALGLGLGLVISGFAFPVSVIGVWALRWGVDALLLRCMASECDGKWWFYLPALEVVYIPYVVFLASAGRLGLFRWKP